MPPLTPRTWQVMYADASAARKWTTRDLLGTAQPAYRDLRRDLVLSNISVATEPGVITFNVDDNATSAAGPSGCGTIKGGGDQQPRAPLPLPLLRRCLRADAVMWRIRRAGIMRFGSAALRSMP